MLNPEKCEFLEAAENFDKKNPKKQKEIKKRTLYHYLQRQEEAYRNKLKSSIDFDEEYISVVKSLAIKKETKVNLTTIFCK